mmetsp:Transcript_23517/g.20425  ORF Transcript_23517/g.20425 Transcript_23517/m.20425 type:complete len:107 (-) Transcript_23517:224-544(-)
MFGVTYPKFDEEKSPTGDQRPKSIAHTFKENGFITGQIQDKCGVISFFNDDRSGKYINIEPWDHEGVPMSCDPNYRVPGNAYSNFCGATSSWRRCLYGEDVHDQSI